MGDAGIANEREPSDPDPILEINPEEDAGADTTGWYHFQHCCAARHCLDMVRPGCGIEWVLCEWHTDYVLGWNDGQRSLVSVKHREADSGYWTIPRLFSDGGLGTLYSRWDACGRPAESRWVTNGGLDLDCRRLRDACASGDVRIQRTMVGDFSTRLGVGAVEVLAFLATLRIYSELPPAAHIRVVDIEHHARPTLTDVGLALESAADAYDAVLELVRTAARAAGPVQPSGWLLASPGALDASALTRADVARRTITRAQVLLALRKAAVPAATALPGTGAPSTRLVRKLRKGEVVPTAIAAARRWRRDWTEYERGTTPSLPGPGPGPDFRKLRSVLTAEAAEAQRSAQQHGEPYGDRMLDDMHRRAASVARELPMDQGIDGRLLMGLAYDLTAQCEIWWSGYFDVEEDDESEATS